jgi:hypothetical protein
VPIAGSSSIRLLAASALLACTDPVGSDTPYVVTPITTNVLAGTPGWTLTDTLVVEVRDAEGHIVPGAKVQWSLPDGGSLAVQLADADSRLTGTTDDRGRNYAVWTLGLSEGTQVARAAAGTESQATFSATATALHAVDVTIGYSHACAVLTDQRPVCWGANSYGQLGVGDFVYRSAPTAVEGLDAALEIVASPSDHTCARDLAGDVWCWGANWSGQTGSLAATRQATPVRVPGAQGAMTLDLGSYFSCAILAVGGARCWGSNQYGRLGMGEPSAGGSFPNPMVVVGGSDFVSLGLTYDRACALDSTGEVWCWGYGSGGELSPAPEQNYYWPIQPIPGYKFSEVALNWYTNCGIAVGGVALCWGNNFGLGYGSPPYQTPAPISPRVDGPFAQLAADRDAFYGRTRGGGLAVWGYSSVIRNYGAPAEVPLPVRAIDVAGGEYGYCVIAETGALYCEQDTYPKSGLRAIPFTPIP